MRYTTAMTKMKDTPDPSTLPRIIQFTGMHDAGPADPRPNGVCPHCGADGRYTHFFKCDDGTERGAMSGCIKLFPVAPTALEQKRLMDKERKLQQTYGKDAHLNSWDTKIQEALDKFFAGEIDEAEAMRVASYQKAQTQAWRDRKYGRRR